MNAVLISLHIQNTDNFGFCLTDYYSTDYCMFHWLNHPLISPPQKKKKEKPLEILDMQSFYRPDVLPVPQPIVSKHRRKHTELNTGHCNRITSEIQDFWRK